MCHNSCLTGRKGKTDWNWAVPELFIGDAVISTMIYRFFCLMDSFVTDDMVWKGPSQVSEGKYPTLKHTDLICTVCPVSACINYSVIADFPNAR